MEIFAESKCLLPEKFNLLLSSLLFKKKKLKTAAWKGEIPSVIFLRLISWMEATSDKHPREAFSPRWLNHSVLSSHTIN